jgi:putative tryptophan/tyrosine transport system substrate-binding protein
MYPMTDRRKVAIMQSCSGSGGDDMQFDRLKRREFITLVGGAATAWPLTAGAEQTGAMRRVGVLTSLAADDPQSQARLAALRQGLQEFGWADGRNVRIDYRWGAGNAEGMRRYAAELIALAPDVVLAGGSEAVAAFQHATRNVAVVFVNIVDPVGAGYVDSLSRPGGNATGFVIYEYGISPKWLELLKEITSAVTRVAVIRDAAIPSGIGQFGAIQGVSASLGVEVSPLGVRDAQEIERAVTAFARGPNGGMIVTGSPATSFHRDLIVDLAARHRLPAVYPLRTFVTGGGLISYGPDDVDQYRQAAGYIDRILKGAKPADLPVQTPTKYKLVINLKTAKALGLEMPASVLARADEVME